MLSHLLSCFGGTSRSCLPGVLLGGRRLLGALHEAVLDLAAQVAQGSHPAGALSGSPLGLDGPIVASNLARGVAGGGASLLLLVPVLLSTVATERVRLVAAFSLSLRSLRLFEKIKKSALIRSRRAAHPEPCGNRQTKLTIGHSPNK